MKYNANLNKKYLDKFHELINSDDIFYRKRRYSEYSKSKKRNIQRNVNAYNLICVCVLRISETVDYLNDFDFKKDNRYKEAFDFYEFVNLISLIFECENTLFNCFGQKLKTFYKDKKSFIKSNPSKKDDITFFKFVRSASSVHPDNTTNYRRITKTTHEFYPYAMWNIEGTYFNLKKGTPKDFDIALNSWNSNLNCFNKYYILYVKEFYDFLNNLLNCFNFLVILAEEDIKKYENNNKYIRLKACEKFENKTECCLYLREKLKKKAKVKEEFPDGGLLIASHIFSNNILDNDFKDYIFDQVLKLSNQMKINISEISYDDIFNELSLYNMGVI